jgi:hypothetical protein
MIAWRVCDGPHKKPAVVDTAGFLAHINDGMCLGTDSRPELGFGSEAGEAFLFRVGGRHD